MEKQIKPGVYLSVLTRERFLDRAENLSRQDLTTFIMRCIPLRLAQTSFLIGHDIGREELLDACRELEPELDPTEDYYTIREFPRKP